MFAIKLKRKRKAHARNRTDDDCKLIIESAKPPNPRYFISTQPNACVLRQPERELSAKGPISLRGFEKGTSPFYIFTTLSLLPLHSPPPRCSSCTSLGAFALLPSLISKLGNAYDWGNRGDKSRFAPLPQSAFRRNVEFNIASMDPEDSRGRKQISKCLTKTLFEGGRATGTFHNILRYKQFLIAQNWRVFAAPIAPALGNYPIYLGNLFFTRFSS